MEITELEKQFAALAEEIEKLKNSGKLTEAADDGAEEEVTDIEDVTDEAVPAEEEVKEEETEEEVVEEAPAENDEDKKLIDSISGNLLRTFMDALNEINILKGEAHDEKFDVVFDEIADNTNKVIGALQAVLGEGNADSDAQEEAREDAEDKLEGDEPEIEEVEKEDELEVIKPVEGEEEEEVEEVAEDEVEESLHESIEVTKSFGIENFEPWGPAVRYWDYITDNLTYRTIEACLENYFGEDAEISETDLNDFVGYHQMGADAISDEEFWDIFGLADPDAEDEEEIEESCGEKKLKESIDLPENDFIPADDLSDYDEDWTDDPDYVIAEWLTDNYGYLVNDFDYEIDEDGDVVVSNIDWDTSDEEEFDESINPDDNPDDVVEAKVGKCHRR